MSHVWPEIFGIGIVAAFVAGSFLASPELRAHAANTVGSIDIIDGSATVFDQNNSQLVSHIEFYKGIFS